MKRDPMTATELRQAARDLDRIKDLDENVANIMSLSDVKLKNLGSAVRESIGRLKLTRMVDDRIGHVTAMALVGALLDERESIAAELVNRVVVPSPPMLPPREAKADE